MIVAGKSSDFQMQDIRLETVVRAGLRQMSAELDGEAVVLSFDDGKYYSLNPIGARIWQLIEGWRKVSDLLVVLLEEYDVEAAQCESDLIVLLTQLRDLRLVEVQDATSA